MGAEEPVFVEVFAPYATRGVGNGVGSWTVPSVVSLELRREFQSQSGNYPANATVE
jgi:hypothetical protein